MNNDREHTYWCKKQKSPKVVRAVVFCVGHTVLNRQQFECPDMLTAFYLKTVAEGTKNETWTLANEHWLC